MRVISNIIAMLTEFFIDFIFWSWPALIVLFVGDAIVYFTDINQAWLSLVAVMSALTFGFTKLYHAKYNNPYTNDKGHNE